MIPNTTLGRLRLIGCREAISFLALLGVGMPLKYFAGERLPTLIMGWIHGLLFILFVAAVAQASAAFKWSRVRTAGALAASVIPFGPFVLDVSLRRDERELISRTSEIALNVADNANPGRHEGL